MVLTDARGNVVVVNPAAEKLFAFNGSRLTGHPLIEAVQDHEVDKLVRECLKTAIEQTTQLDSVTGRFLRTVAVPIVIGNERGAVVLFQDLTEVRSLQTMRREFVGNVSHELRTPLAGMKAIVETLRDGAVDDKQVAAGFLDRLETEVDGMTQMVAELIELSRIETGGIKLKLEPVNLNELAAEVVARLGPQAERQQVTLTTRLAADLPEVPADRDRLRQVIVNIVHNAIKFTPAGRPDSSVQQLWAMIRSSPKSPTPESGYPPMTCPMSSSDSSRPTGRGLPAEPDWACRLPSTPCSPTAASSWSTANRAKGRPSASACP